MGRPGRAERRAHSQRSEPAQPGDRADNQAADRAVRVRRGSDGVSNLGGPLPALAALPFISGVDDYIPAEANATGKAALSLTSRGRELGGRSTPPTGPRPRRQVSIQLNDFERVCWRCSPGSRGVSMRKPASSTPVRRSRIPVLAVILGLAIAPAAAAQAPSTAARQVTPVIFVHGGAGSGRAVRVPADAADEQRLPASGASSCSSTTRLRRSPRTSTRSTPRLDALIARIKARTGVSTGRRPRALAGHHGDARLPGATRRARPTCRRYVNIDGRTAATPPAGSGPSPCGPAVASLGALSAALAT